MKAVKTTFVGALCGLGASVLLIMLGFACDFISCACSVVTCDFDSSASMTSAVLDNFGVVCKFCIICGAIVGLVYGLYKMKEEADQNSLILNAEQEAAARKQRQTWASEMKQKAMNVSNTCNQNKESDKLLVSTTYKASSQMTEIMNELTKAAEKQGKVDSLAEELSKKGDASV